MLRHYTTHCIDNHALATTDISEGVHPQEKVGGRGRIEAPLSLSPFAPFLRSPNKSSYRVWRRAVSSGVNGSVTWGMD